MTEDLRVKSGERSPQANIINTLKCQSKTNKQKMASGEKNSHNLHMPKGFKLSMHDQKKISPGKSISYWNYL